MDLNTLNQRDKEGYFLLDHSQTEGMSDELIVASGLPPGAGQGLFEAPTYTCSHCSSVVVLNPKRNRERAFCRGCDHYICDACGVIKAQNGICRTMKQIIEEEMARVEKRQASASVLVLP